jgi:stigma-specific protein Stig1
MIPGRLSVLAFLAIALALLPGCPNGAGISCPTGQTLCGDKCIFVNSDPANCGGCGVACPGSLACIAGSCGCPVPLSNCGNVCVDENVDGNNCGGCGVTCGPGLVCAGGSCAVTCGPNLLQCGSACFDGNVDPHNCGMCGHTCGDFELCCGGMCVMSGTFDHCGSCAPCPNPGDFCFDGGPGMGLTCSAG